MRTKADKRTYDKARYASNREAVIARSRQWYVDHKGDKRTYDVKRRPIKNSRRRAEYVIDPSKFLSTPEQNRRKCLRRYGMTIDQFNEMFEAQGKCCACCRRTELRGNRGWCVDHDHATGLVRGIVCGLCNTGIGALGDDIAGLKKALDYLNRHYKEIS